MTPRSAKAAAWVNVGKVTSIFLKGKKKKKKLFFLEICSDTTDRSENFRKALTLWEVSDAIETHRKLSEAIQSINRLELVKSQFEE